MSDFILGVDPGANGAACLFSVKNSLPQEFFDCNKDNNGLLVEEYLESLRRVAVKFPKTRVVIERVWARPGQSALTTWAQAAVYAQTALWLDYWFELPVTYVAPVTWKKALNLNGVKGMTPDQRKKLTLSWARARWPNEPWFRLEKHQDRADAAAIAFWFLHHWGKT